MVAAILQQNPCPHRRQRSAMRGVVAPRRGVNLAALRGIVCLRLLRICCRSRRIRRRPSLLGWRRASLDEQAFDHRVARAHWPLDRRDSCSSIGRRCGVVEIQIDPAGKQTLTVAGAYLILLFTGLFFAAPGSTGRPGISRSWKLWALAVHAFHGARPGTHAG